MTRRSWLAMLSGAGLVVLLGIGLVYWRYTRRHQAEPIRERLEQELAQGDFTTAKIDAQRLVQLAPKDPQTHYLRGLALLAGRPANVIKTNDADGIEAIRSLVRATKLDGGLTHANRLLVTYFLSVGDWAEADLHASAVLRDDARDLDAHFAKAGRLLDRGQANGAAAHLDLLWNQESASRPAPRPRAAWLLARVGELVGRRGDQLERVEAYLDVLAQEAPTSDSALDGRDWLSLVELWNWQARRESNPERRKEALKRGLESLETLVAAPRLDEVPPRDVLDVIDRLGEAPGITPPTRERLDQLVETVFTRAVDASTLDPAIYLHFANRLLASGRGEQAAQVARQGIARAAEFGPEARVAYAPCDLWLAEYHLSRREPDLARPSIEILAGIDAYRPWARLLIGFQALSDGKLEDAASNLSEAVAGMPKNGVAHALLGLCQLRRGLVSEGRQLLEKGIRLGATEPRYQAWLALALTEAGYHDQAIVVARQLIADPKKQGLGRALLGQLKLRAGQLGDAEKDFADAIALAEPAHRPALRLSLAELAAERGDWSTAAKVLQDLQATELAPQALAIEYRYLLGQGKTDEATHLLAEARAKYPGSMALLALEARGLLERREFDQATALLERETARAGESLLPILLLVETRQLAGDPAGAIAVLRQARTRRPHEHSLAARLADRLIASGRADDAAEAERVIAELTANPSAPRSTVYSLQARLAAEQGDWSRAEEILTKAAADDPDNPSLRLLLGQLAARNGDHAVAVKLFEQSMASGTLWQQAARGLFESLLSTGAIDRAEDLLGQSRRRGKPARAMQWRLIELLARRDQATALDRQLDELFQSEPIERDLALTAAILRGSGQAERGLALVDRGLERFPESTLLKEHKAALLAQRGEARAALDLLRSMTDPTPQRAALEVECLLSLAERNQGATFDDAEKAARAAWDKNPGDIVVAALLCQSMLHQGRDEEAAAFAVAAHKNYPSFPAADFLLARMYEAVGKPDRALAAFERILAAEPGSQSAAKHYLRLASLGGGGKDPAELARELLVRCPDQPTLLAVVAEAHATRGERAEAESYLERLPAAERKGALASYIRATAAAARGETKESERLAQPALADPRTQVPATLLLARLRVQEGKAAEALELARQVVRQSPDLVAAVGLEVEQLIALGALDEARDRCRDFLRNRPNEPAIELALANALVRSKGEEAKKEALQIARKALAAGVNRSANLESWLAVAARAGAGAGAVDDLRSLALAGPSDLGETERLLAAARGALQAGNWSSASALAEESLARSPANVAALLVSGDALARLAEAGQDRGLFERAAARYREVLERQPNDLAAANNLAWTVGIALGQPRAALDELAARHPAVLSPRGPLPAEVLDTVGALNMKLERWNDARTYLETAVERNPRSAASHFHLGLLHQKQGRSTLARQSFDRAVALEPDGPWARRIDESLLGN